MTSAGHHGGAANPFADPQRLDFIDALRGLAILGVMMSHTVIAVPAASATLQTIMTAGARGVQLFYVASAIALGLSWRSRSLREQRPTRNFYLRRLFRIAPMFYLAIAMYLLLNGRAPHYFAPNGIKWHYVLQTGLFINGFHPETFTSVVPGGWSIAVEMMFYLVLPLLMRYLKTTSSVLLFVVITALLDRIVTRVILNIYLPLYPPSQAHLVHDFAYLSFFSQLPVFACGLLALTLSSSERFLRYAATIALPAFVVVCTSIVALGFEPLARLATRHILFGAGFAISAMALMYRPVRLLVNPVTTSIGRLSYSMYVVHFAVITACSTLGLVRLFGRSDASALLFYSCVVALTCAVAWVTYRLVESPGIEAGRRLIANLARSGTLSRGLHSAERAW